MGSSNSSSEMPNSFKKNFFGIPEISDTSLKVSLPRISSGLNVPLSVVV